MTDSTYYQAQGADLVAPACCTSLGPAVLRDDGRWIIGWCTGPGGSHEIVLPLGSDPASVSVAVMQAAIDDAGRLASVRTLGEVVLVRGPWLPIATAPIDGTPVLAGWAGGELDVRVAVYWARHLGWHEHFGGLGLDPPPTHWAPLPSPPTDKATEGK